MKKTHRFIGKFEIGADRLLIRDAELAHQLRSVLKLRKGEKIVLADGKGREALCSIEDISGAGAEVAVEARRLSDEPERKVTLYCAVLKSDNFEFVVEKAVETGASRIVPVITARTVKQGIKQERLAKIAHEAAEQCGRGIVPEVACPMAFRAALKDAAELDRNYFFDASGEDYPRPQVPCASVGIWIGPEGGWEDFELDAARENKFIIASLGKLILRAETAAAVATYLTSG